jgi:hypothetical protein
MMKHQAQAYELANAPNERRFSDDLFLYGKGNAETTYEIRRGERQDTSPAILLCVVL